MPIASAVVTEMIISASVSRLASHTPRSPKLKTPAAASSAMRHPATTPASDAAPTTRPSHVIRSRIASVWS